MMGLVDDEIDSPRFFDLGRFVDVASETTPTGKLLDLEIISFRDAYTRCANESCDVLLDFMLTAFWNGDASLLRAARSELYRHLEHGHHDCPESVTHALDHVNAALGAMSAVADL